MAFTTRFTMSITNSLENAAFEDEWIDGMDLFAFLKKQIFHAFMKAVFGKRIFELNPSLCEDFWAFDSNVPDLAKGIPRWLASNKHKTRDRCIQSFLKWHFHLEEQTLKETISVNQEYDPVFRSKLIQQRHKAFSEISPSIMCARSKASEDLALMWA